MGIIDDLGKKAAKQLLVTEELDYENNEVDKATYEFRKITCLMCPQRLPKQGKCKACGCYLTVKWASLKNRNAKKLRIETTHCPLGFWKDSDLANYYKNN